jgi:phosphocarrier protein
MNRFAGKRGRGAEAALRRTVTISNQLGLHARAAARFVQVASGFDADITVTRLGTSVSGSSILGLMMLAAAPGQDIEIEARGADAAAALSALAALVDHGFGEE